MKAVLCAVCLVVLAGCAQQPPLQRETASGRAEESYEGTTTEAVKAALMDLCGRRAALVQEASANQVVCGKTMTGGDAMLAQLLVGNSYSTTPELKVRFTIYAIGGRVRVTAQQWIETQMALGQIRRQELNSNEHRNNLQQALASLSPDPVEKPTATTMGPGIAVQRAAAPTSAGGQYAIEAERLARQCAAQPKAALTAKGPGFESYTVKCDNGDALAVRCDLGSCRALK